MEYAGAYPAHFERMMLENSKKEDKEFINRILEQLPEEKEKIKHQLSVERSLGDVCLCPPILTIYLHLYCTRSWKDKYFFFITKDPRLL
jgi:hypothetical protein